MWVKWKTKVKHAHTMFCMCLSYSQNTSWTSCIRNVQRWGLIPSTNNLSYSWHCQPQETNHQLLLRLNPQLDPVKELQIIISIKCFGSNIRGNTVSLEKKESRHKTSPISKKKKVQKNECLNWSWISSEGDYNYEWPCRWYPLIFSLSKFVFFPWGEVNWIGIVHRSGFTCLTICIYSS